MANVKSTPTKSLVRVGDGRGFVVEEKRGLCLYPKRFVVTAVHCLPRIPKPPGRQESLWEETLPDVLGRLGRARPRIWAECLFIDQVGDIAVLGSPDNQEPGEQAMAHEELVEQATLLIHRCPSRLGRTDAGITDCARWFVDPRLGTALQQLSVG